MWLHQEEIIIQQDEEQVVQPGATILFEVRYEGGLHQAFSVDLKEKKMDWMGIREIEVTRLSDRLSGRVKGMK